MSLKIQIIALRQCSALNAFATSYNHFPILSGYQGLLENRMEKEKLCYEYTVTVAMIFRFARTLNVAQEKMHSMNNIFNSTALFMRKIFSSK